MGRDQEQSGMVVDDAPLFDDAPDVLPDASDLPGDFDLLGEVHLPEDLDLPEDTDAGDAALAAVLDDPATVAEHRAVLDAWWEHLQADLDAEHTARLAGVRARLEDAPADRTATAIVTALTTPELAGNPDALVAAATAARRLEAWAVWQQLQAIAGLLQTWSVSDVPTTRTRRARSGWRPGHDVDPAVLVRESVVTEVAWAFGIGEQTAADRVTAAELLIIDSRLPQTARLLAEGRIDWPKVWTIVSRTRHLNPAAPAPEGSTAPHSPDGPDVDADAVQRDASAATVDLARLVDADVAPTAPGVTVPALRAAVDLSVARVDADAAAHAAARARKQRRVGITAGWDGPGTAQLWAIGPADAITAAHEGLDAAARHLRSGGDTRTLDQLRHDLLVTACTTGALHAPMDGVAATPPLDPLPAVPTARAEPVSAALEAAPSPVPASSPSARQPRSQPDVPGDGTSRVARDARSPAGHDAAADVTPGSGPGPGPDVGMGSAAGPDAGLTTSTGAPASAVDEERFVPPWFGTTFPDVGVNITVTVSLETLLGLNDDPALLGDQGPIPAELARDLASNGIWRCVAVDDTHGSVLGVASTTFTPGYTPGARLKKFLDHAAPRCSSPGCRTRAVRCDIDHRVPHDQGGATCSCNAQPLCRRHHRLKTAGLLTSTLTTDPKEPPGSVTWMSRAGRTHISRPHAPLTRSQRPPEGPAGATGPPPEPPPF